MPFYCCIYVTNSGTDDENRRCQRKFATDDERRYGDGRAFKPPMKSLYLLRHAKSAWNEPALTDHDRPLAPRGLAAAAMMGYHLRDRALPKPDLVLCSTARRAVDTLGICLGAWGIPLRTKKLKSLYLCGADGLLRRIQATPDSANTVMLVAHNPDMHDMAMHLANSGSASKLDALREKFPTGCFARFSFGVESWKDVSADSGALLTFLQPRDLD